VPASQPEPARHPFAYAVVRVVPRVDRGEAINAGIVLLCRTSRFLGARVALDEARLRALDPACDAADVWPHLRAIERIAAGDPAGGPIASLSQPERYHWLVAPSSTIIQPSEAHTGLTADPAATLEHLFATLVLTPAPADGDSVAATDRAADGGGAPGAGPTAGVGPAAGVGPTAIDSAPHAHEGSPESPRNDRRK
jgi:hypothetical protein